MIPSTLRAKHPALAAQLRDTPQDMLSDPMGDAALTLGNQCLETQYDIGRMYLQTLQMRRRDYRPQRLDSLIEELRSLIVADATRVPPKGLEEEMCGLVSPQALRLAGARW